MPGLVGYVRHQMLASSAFRFEAMGRLLEGDARFTHHLYVGDGFGLGRVSLDIQNPQPQPIWNRERSSCVVMEGELYEQRRLRHGLEQRGVQFQTESDAELVMHLYEAYGESFAVQLNGVFAIAIWDGDERKMVVVQRPTE